MKQRVTMGERVPTNELIHRVAHLLNRFADEKHPGLTDEKFERFVYPLTGVIVRRTWSDNPALVLFTFFISGRKGTASEVNKWLSVEFDLNDFHANPMDYIQNMVKDTAKRISAADFESMRVTPTRAEVVDIEQHR